MILIILTVHLSSLKYIYKIAFLAHSFAIFLYSERNQLKQIAFTY